MVNVAPRCTPGTLLNRYHLHKTKKHGTGGVHNDNQDRGDHILGSPYSVRVLATSAKAAASLVTSGSTLAGRVDIPAYITIQAYDRYGNRLCTAADDFRGELPEEDRVNLLVSQLSDPIGDGQPPYSLLRP